MSEEVTKLNFMDKFNTYYSHLLNNKWILLVGIAIVGLVVYYYKTKKTCDDQLNDSMLKPPLTEQQLQMQQLQLQQQQQLYQLQQQQMQQQTQQQTQQQIPQHHQYEHNNEMIEPDADYMQSMYNPQQHFSENEQIREQDLTNIEKNNLKQQYLQSSA
jgi:transcription initiation factor TFIID subunit TAF12